MESLWQDVRFGVRVLLKNPGFTAIAVLVLGLGIGANTAIFSLVNAFLLRPMAVQNPDELVSCYNKDTRNNSYRSFSYPEYCDIRDKNTVFSNLLAHDLAFVGVTEGDSTRRIFADIVSSNYFATFGVRMFRGREFLPAEERPGSAIPVAIVSYQYWKKTGRDPDLIGKTVRINSRPYTIVGIAPEEFTGVMAMLSPEIWLPLGVDELVVNDFMTEGKARRLENRDNYSMFLIGRLKPGMTAAKAGPELEVLAAQLAQAYPKENKDHTFFAQQPSRFSVSTNPTNDKDIKTVSILLSSVAGVVLLIACLNLANMLLARGTARRREFAIRLALGGGRLCILRQLLTEGLMLSFLGGTVGLCLAYWGSSLLIATMRSLIPLDLVFNSGPDVRVLGAMLGFCVLSTLISGLGPAWQLSRPNVVADLKEHAGEDTGAAGRRLMSRRNMLVIAQLALSLALLVAAGLFVRGALKAANVDPGFSMDNGIIVELDTSLAGYSETRGRELFRLVVERLGALPGVEAAGLAATVPFGMVSLGREVRHAGDNADQSDASTAGKRTSARFNSVGADYFKALGLRLLRGRTFNAGEAETGSAPRVAIVDDRLAKKLFPNEDALGKRIQFGGGKPGEQPKPIEIVGIAPNIRENLIGSASEPHVFVPFGQEYQSSMSIHLKTAARGKEAESALLQTVRREIRAIDERLPVLSLKTLRGHLDASIEMWIVRTGAWLFTIFGSVALFLAVVGVYAVRSYTVARRTREIGIRMALGATTSDALRLVLREGLVLTLAGVGLGFLLALAAGRLLGSMLYEVSGTDPLVLTAAPLLLAAISLTACYLPARRAARVNPIVALRYE
jgi:predicted permease